MFTCFVFCSIFAAISLRSAYKTVFETQAFGNKQLFCCVALVLCVQMLIVHVKPLSDFFNVVPLTAIEIIYLLLYSASVLVIMDSVKLLLRLFAYIARHLAKTGGPISLSSWRAVAPH